MKYISKTTVIASLWILNPVIACDNVSGFDFGEEELLQLMDSVGSTTWTIEQNSVEYEIRFQLEKGEENFDPDQEPDELGRIRTFSVLSSAQACGTRSFIAEADACIDTTYLSVTGMVEVIEIENQNTVLEEQIDGSIFVLGKQLNNAEFRVEGEESMFFLYSNDGVDFKVNEVSW